VVHVRSDQNQPERLLRERIDVQQKDQRPSKFTGRPADEHQNHTRPLLLEDQDTSNAKAPSTKDNFKLSMKSRSTEITPKRFQSVSPATAHLKKTKRSEGWSVYHKNCVVSPLAKEPRLKVRQVRVGIIGDGAGQTRKVQTKKGISQSYKNRGKIVSKEKTSSSNARQQWNSTQKIKTPNDLSQNLLSHHEMGKTLGTSMKNQNAPDRKSSAGSKDLPSPRSEVPIPSKRTDVSSKARQLAWEKTNLSPSQVPKLSLDMLSSDDEAYNTNWTDDISSLTDFAEEVDLPCILNESPTLGAKRRDNLTRDWARSPVAQPKVS